MYEILISVGLPYMNQSWAVMVLLMFFLNIFATKTRGNIKKMMARILR